MDRQAVALISTSIMLNPLEPAARSVRSSTVITSACLGLVIQALCPLTTHSSPSHCGVGLRAVEQIRAGLRLGQRQRAKVFAVGQQRDEAVFLLRRPPADNRSEAEAVMRADRERRAAADAAKFLDGDKDTAKSSAAPP